MDSRGSLVKSAGFETIITQSYNDRLAKSSNISAKFEILTCKDKRLHVTGTKNSVVSAGY